MKPTLILFKLLSIVISKTRQAIMFVAEGGLPMLSNQTKRRLMFLGIPAMALLLIGMTQRTPGELQMPEGSELPAYSSFLVATEDIDNHTGAARYDEFSILSDFYVMTQFNNLVVGRDYNVEIDVYDAKGRKVTGGEERTVRFTAEHPKFAVYAPVSPEYPRHKPGTWKAVFKDKKLGTLKYKFTVAPPTPDQKDNLQRYEQMRENGFKAFAHNWMGASHRDEVMFMAVLESKGDEDSHSDIGELLANARFFQFARAQYKFYEDPVSTADKLNGITYRGKMQVRFPVFRMYHAEKGWTEWFDIARPTSEASQFMVKLLSGAFDYTAGVMGSIFGNGGPFSTPPLTHGLRYEIILQDGNWIVVDDLGNAYINGEKKDEVERVPLTFQVLQPALLPTRNLYQPWEKSAHVVLKKGADPRDVMKKLGDSVRASPRASKKQVGQTMRLLRGQNL